MKRLYLFDSDGRCFSSATLDDESRAVEAAMRNGAVTFAISEDIHALKDIYYGQGGMAVIPTSPSEVHVFNYTTQQWEDPRTLQDHKDAKWTEIKRARSAAEYGGFTWDGSTFDSDAISQARIQGAVQLASMAPDFSIGWTLATNKVRTLSSADMLAVGAALGAHVAAQFSRAQALRVLVDAAESADALDALSW